MMCHAGFGGVDPQTNEYSCFLETFGGGDGGCYASDGPDAVQTRPEHRERAGRGDQDDPVRAVRLSLVEDWGGPGRFRGGLGLRKDFVFDRAANDEFTVLADRTLAGPAGAFGGRPGKPAEYVLIRDRVETLALREDDDRGRARRHRQLPHLWRRRVRPAGGARAQPRRAGRARGKGQPRGRTRGVRVAAVTVDPISFEVIRNALVAEPTTWPSRQPARNHQIKTRSDFVRVLRRAAALGRPGFAQPVHLGSMVEQVPNAVRAYGAENLGRRRARDERPAPERRPPERRQPDLTRPPRGRADRLRREPRAPRRRRRRRAGLDRGRSGGLPGGRDHPAGQAGRRRRDRE